MAIQRDVVRKDFTRDEKCKTAKCKLCEARITVYSMQCGHCKKRICSQCIEGIERDPQNKDVAADHTKEGCWCGFKSGINAEFKNKLAKPAEQIAPAAKKAPAKKSKRSAKKENNDGDEENEQTAGAAATTDEQPKKSVTRSKKEASVAEESNEQAQDSFEATLAADPLTDLPKKRSTRSTKNPFAAEEVTESIEPALPTDDIDDPPKKKVGRPKKDASVSQQATDVDTINEQSRRRTRSMTADPAFGQSVQQNGDAVATSGTLSAEAAAQNARPSKGKGPISESEEATGQPQEAVPAIAKQTEKALKKPAVSNRSTRANKLEAIPESDETTVQSQEPAGSGPSTTASISSDSATGAKRRRSDGEDSDEPEVSGQPSKKRKGKFQQAIADPIKPQTSESAAKTDGETMTQGDPAAVNPTVTTNNPPKRGTKRTRGVEPEFEIEEQPGSKKRKASDPSVTTSPPKQKATRGRRNGAGPAITGKNTVIIGAGVIGLFTAYELAKKVQTEEDHVIHVVDINDNEFALASGHCSGFITADNAPEEWEPLFLAAFPAWRELFDDTDFRKNVHHTDRNFTTDEGEDNPGVDWFKGGPLTTDRDTTSRVDTAQLGAWLRTECERMGVRFRFACHPAELQRDRINGGMKMKLNQVNGPARHDFLGYTSLVLAAGPFTKEIFHRLFPQSSAILPDNSPAPAEWANVTVAASNKKESTGVEMPNKRVSIVSHDAAAEVKISFCRKAKPGRKLKVHDAVDLNLLGKSRELAAEAASEFLVGPGRIVSSGSMWVSEGAVVGKVPRLASGVDGGLDDPLDAGQRRVVLAFGFGMTGTTLAPAVADEVVRLLGGEEGQFGALGVVEG